MTPKEPVRIVLTPEQREAIKRLSGQHVEAIDVEADDMEKGGGSLRLSWRLSVATGIPRQIWTDEDEGEPRSSEKKLPK